MLKEFKQFIARGNVIDLAVAVVIGAAFTLVVNSFVEGIINPIIGLLGGADLSSLSITLKDATATEEAVVLRYGDVLSAIINFLLVAAAVFFLVVKPINVLAARRLANADAPEENPAPTDEAVLLSEIRDLLRTQQAPGQLP